MTKRYKLNVVGPFYVEDGCCTLCGVPTMAAPELFDESDEHCWVKKQPVTAVEVDHMLDAMRGAELDCIRYAGRHPDIIRRIHKPMLCDEVRDRTAPSVVTFAAHDLSGAELLERFGDYLRSREPSTRVMPPISDAMRLTIRVRRVLESPRTLELEHVPDARWQLHHDGDSQLTDAIHRWLVTFAAEIRWQTERGEQPKPW